MGKLFGTDGVRGVANRDLSPELAFKLGRAGAHVLAREAGKEPVLIGRDTRISGDMLEAALAAGICSAGLDVIKLGVLPTPAVAFLTRELGASAGVVISASHNPVEDNGIKFFAGDGYKLPDKVEEEIESLVLGGLQNVLRPVGVEVGRIKPTPFAAERYIKFAKETSSTSFDGLKIVVDCANGAAFEVAPRILSELGAEVIPIFNDPDGTNINVGCGSTNPEVLQSQVLARGADLGLAFDGDADRLIAVDEDGNLVDGDRIMLTCARYLKEKGRLAKNTVVVTVMSNLGLHEALKREGINVIQTNVGDRYVLEELKKSGANFGGEQSGHIIFLEHSTTGDGIVTALQLLNVVRESGASLKELAGQMKQFPQVLENIKVEDKEKIMQNPVLVEAVDRCKRRFNGNGRVLVRPSGTESLIRVMVEARDPVLLKETVSELVSVVKSL